MLNSGRHAYCVFMCHLSVEKALKALFSEKLAKNPPKTHSLVYLVQSAQLEVTIEIRDFLEGLDEISVPVRYPDELKKMLKEYNKVRTKIIFVKSKEVLKWLKEKLGKQ